jgi:O-antigen/teichoic acid export membrane protein
VSRRLRAEMGWLWAGYVARSLAYLGLTVALTRTLGASRFGELALFLALALGVAQVAGSWPFLAVPVLSAQGTTIADALRLAARVAIFATTAALVIAIPLEIATQSAGGIAIAALMGYSVALVGLQGVYGVLQADDRIPGIAAVQTAERSTALIAMLIAIAITAPTVVTVEVLFAISTSVTCLMSYAYLQRRHQIWGVRSGGRPDHAAGTVMSAVGAMGIASVCAYGVAWIDIFVLTAFKPHRDVGVYLLAYQMFTFVVGLGSLWSVAALPRHARSSAAGHTLDTQLPIDRVLAAASLWAVLVAGIALGAAFAIPIVFGANFQDAIAPLMLLLAGGIFAGGYFLVLPGLIASGRALLIARISLISVGINLFLDLILVPTIGLIGPAIATAGQTLFASMALMWAVLGGRAAVRVLASGLPAATAVALLAMSPRAPALVVMTVVASALTLAWGVASLRRSSR